MTATVTATSASLADLTAEEAATYCGVSLRTIQRWLAAGLVTATCRDGRAHIAVRDLAPRRRQLSASLADTDDSVSANDAMTDMADTVSANGSEMAANSDVSRLETENAWLRGEVERLHEALVVQAQLAAAVEALPAPAAVTYPTDGHVSPRWWAHWAWWRRQPPR